MYLKTFEAESKSNGLVAENGYISAEAGEVEEFDDWLAVGESCLVEPPAETLH